MKNITFNVKLLKDHIDDVNRSKKIALTFGTAAVAGTGGYLAGKYGSKVSGWLKDKYKNRKK